MREDKIIARIARALAEGDAVEGLIRTLSATDLQSLMLRVYRERSARRTPAELLEQYQQRAMVRPRSVEVRTLLEVERAAFGQAHAFEAVDLAPVAPLGINSVLGQIDQNNCLATIRSAEVLADPTTSQALECARRRKAGDRETIRLCARSKQLRLQPFDKPGFSPHFTIFSLVTAGRDRGSLTFELESLREHLSVYLALLRHLGSLGFHFASVDIAVSDTADDEGRLARAQAEVLAPLAAEYPEALLRIDRTREQGRHYYSGLCLRLDAVNHEGQRVNLADGGFTNWTQRLLSNAKERLLVSGIGIELIVLFFRSSVQGR
ncbi:hypothetical protein POL68_24630 [Stigmatella sp. ncwal1]|uniref:Uncharacterized protein n=1 Tax=Stigmatella ashevillensis TaxID=2995309 RepID=A0ABT5DH69_9BACT|nr:hypothetical protein [Stigmatella ashevillena]MDC0711677.1 hypothetical protein [Stigmatella ashevillena]